MDNAVAHPDTDLRPDLRPHRQVAAAGGVWTVYIQEDVNQNMACMLAL